MGAVGGAGYGAASELALNRGLEAVVAERAWLLNVHADFSDLVWG
jgi:hypothetical protein